MESFLKNVVIFILSCLLFTVNHAVDGDNTISSFKIEQFRSKINSNADSSNLGAVRKTRSTQFVQEITHGEEQESESRPLTKRNLLALQNTLSRLVEIVESLNEKVCPKQPEENSTLIAQVEDTQRHVIRKPKLKPHGQCSDTSGDNIPEITKEHLLQYLRSIPDSRTISGSILDLSHRELSRNLIQNITGVQPGIRSIYIHHIPELIVDWESDLEEAMEQWNNNSLLILQWFPCPPTTGESCSGPEIQKQFTTSEWNDLITEGGHLNRLWKIRLNTMLVPSLKKLESAGVVVMIDPFLAIVPGYWYSENRDATGSRRLYQITHDYLTKEHQLTSMIWKWSVLYAPNLETYMNQFWPGNEYVDAASVIMVGTKEPSVAVYRKLKNMVGEKPMSMEWLLYVPTAELLQRQPRWTWFTIAESVFWLSQPHNNHTDVQASFQNHAVINQGGIDIFTKYNYALQGKATASSVQGADLKADRVNDGKNSTRWSSEFSDPQWLQIDLGQVRVLKNVKIIWEHAFAKGYQIQASEDNVNWKIVHEEYNGKGGVEEVFITVPLSAQYVKIFGFQRGTGYGYSILEIEVY